MGRQPVLFVSVNDRCYASYRFFAARLAEAVEQSGVPAAWCYLAAGDQNQEENWNRILQEVLGKKYLAVVDFNSFLPKLETGGTNFIELFGAPFYHIILDHPLYHHAALSANTDLQRIICVDECHADYVRANYPRIGRVFAQTLPGSPGCGKDTPFSERKNEIFFCGTYEEPEQYWKLMDTLPEEYKKECRALAGRMLDEPDRTMEELLAELWEEEDARSSRLAERMQAEFLADAYVRNLRRKRVIEALLKAKLPLALYGQGWEALGAKAGGRLSYGEYVDRLGEYRLALHCMPGFVCGGHDRISNAMRNGTVCLSDRNRYTRSRYEQGRAVYAGYETGDAESLIAACERYLTHTGEAKELAAAGRKYGDEHHTWEAFAEWLLLEMEVS